jgi:hypothetical protein
MVIHYLFDFGTLIRGGIIHPFAKGGLKKKKWWQIR